MKILAVAVLAAFLLGGCFSADVNHPAMGPAPSGLAAHELKDNFSGVSSGTLRFRQVARFTFRGRTVAMVGMMELQPTRGKARLVAVNELGIKLFDLEVSEDQILEHYVVPELSRFPRFGEAVAFSLRRVFLAPRPAPQKDSLEFTGNRYLLTGKRDEGRVEFIFGEAHAAMIQKSMSGRSQKWRVIYRHHRRFENGFIPYDMELTDKVAGYRLELKIIDVKAGHEQTER